MLQGSPITVVRARPALCEAVDPYRPLGVSFWRGAGSHDANLGVVRECEHQVLARYRSVECEGNTLTSPAFGDVYCRPRDEEEYHFKRRVLGEHPGPEGTTQTEAGGPSSGWPN